MATSGDVEEVPEPGMDHPAEPFMGVGGKGDQLVPTTEDISRLLAAETTSDHHEAAQSTTEHKVPAVPLPVAKELQEAAEDDGQESVRERLKRCRREMAGRLWVPDMWGQEKLLKDWVDCAVFDLPLVPPDLLTARQALVAECCARRPSSPALSVCKTAAPDRA